MFLESERGDALTFRPTACADGDELGFFGAQFTDDHFQILDFHRRDGAPAVQFYSPGNGAFLVREDDCDVLDGDLLRHFNSSTGNGKVEGRLELSCTSPRGWLIEGVLNFEDCGPPDDGDDDDDCDHHHSHTHDHGHW